MQLGPNGATCGGDTPSTKIINSYIKVKGKIYHIADLEELTEYEVENHIIKVERKKKDKLRNKKLKKING